MVAKVKTSAIVGVEALPCDVEVDVSKGKDAFIIIGLGDGAVRESKDRVLSAIRAAGFRVPRRVLVNLAPAEIRKEGASFDLPIAVGILMATGQLAGIDLRRVSLHGELSLNGKVRAVRGAIALAAQARQSGDAQIVVPKMNAYEAALITGLQVIAVDSLAELAAVLQGRAPIELLADQLEVSTASPDHRSIDEVWGQELAKRALIVAAAGGHNLLMIGPPGCGKSMLAERLATVLPPLRSEEMLEVVKIHSLAGCPVQHLLRGDRPFRSPHHSISDVAMVGGGSLVRPGEVSMAHRGVLFLDEFPEFRRSVLESLRAPLESGAISIARARERVTLPARCQLIAAMNPCPCGRLGSSDCRCSRGAVLNYLQKLSEPILDRIDLQVELDPVPLSVVTGAAAATSVGARSVDYKGRVAAAQERQLERSGKLNAALSGEELKRELRFSKEAIGLLERGSQRQQMSVRGFVRVLRVAATIADLENAPSIEAVHMAEALTLRSLDRLRAYCAG